MAKVQTSVMFSQKAYELLRDHERYGFSSMARMVEAGIMRVTSSPSMGDEGMSNAVRMAVTEFAPKEVDKHMVAAEARILEKMQQYFFPEMHRVLVEEYGLKSINDEIENEDFAPSPEPSA